LQHDPLDIVYRELMCYILTLITTFIIFINQLIFTNQLHIIMRKKITIFTKKNFRFLGFALFTLLLVNCSKDDDPVTFEFDEFDNLSELPELEDPDPEFTDPDLGSVEASDATQLMLTDFQDGSGDLDDTTKNNLTAVSDFSDGLTTNFEAEAQALDAAGIDAILNASELTGDLAALAAELDPLPASVAALFPAIAFTDDYNRAQQEQMKAGIVINDLKLDLMSQATEGPCYDAALAAYTEAMKTTIETKDAQTIDVNTNYNTRVTDADTRYTSRLAALDAYNVDIKDAAVAILAYSDSIKDSDADLAATLRNFALFYVVNSYTMLDTFQTEATSLLTDTKTTELASIETIKTEQIQSIQSNFDVVKAEADALLTAANNNCHNQGSGS